MEIRANLVRLTSADGVALRAAGLEEGSTLCRVTYTRQSSSAAFFGILETYQQRKALSKVKARKREVVQENGGERYGECGVLKRVVKSF